MSASIDNAFLYNLPALIRDYLYTDEYFRQFPIIIDDRADTASDVDRALAGQLAGPTGLSGLTLVINTAASGGALPNAPAFFNVSARITFEIVEVPALNRGDDGLGTGEPTLVVAEALVATLKNFRSGETSWSSTNFYESDAVIGPPIDVRDDSGRATTVIRAVTMHCTGGVIDQTAVVEQPALVNNALTITLTCATAGAEIYYTTDGTRPVYYAAANANNVGALYTAPFAVASGTTVTARAVKSGSRASLVRQEVVT